MHPAIQLQNQNQHEKLHIEWAALKPRDDSKFKTTSKGSKVMAI